MKKKIGFGIIGSLLVGGIGYLIYKKRNVDYLEDLDDESFDDDLDEDLDEEDTEEK